MKTAPPMNTEIFRTLRVAPTLTSCNSEALEARRMYFTFLKISNLHYLVPTSQGHGCVLNN